MIAFDLETYLITPRVVAPKPVVASFCSENNAPELVRFPSAWARIREMLQSDDTIVGANIAYDFGVVAVHQPELLPLIIEKYDNGGVWDVQIAAFLDHVARGEAPTDTEPIIIGAKKFTRFSLEACVAIYLGRLDAKANDTYRLRYGELDARDIAEWPAEAVQYPKDDAVNTLKVALRQREVCENQQKIHNKNFTHQTLHARAAFAMQLGTIYGLATDRDYLTQLETKYLDAYNAERAQWQEKGLVRADGKDDSVAIKRRVILAYNQVKPEDCGACQGTGKVPGKTKKPIGCKKCSGTGWTIPDTVPRTPGDGVSAGHDTLVESHDAILEAFDETNTKKKPLTTYIPFLKANGVYEVHVSANALVETGRCSYKGPLQQFPRTGGVREACIPASGNVYFSVDYTALELCSLAQVCIELGFGSKMAELINADIDVHAYFGSKIINISVEEFEQRRANKDKYIKNIRQGAKGVNFGLPGGMGVAKFVFTQRKIGVRFCQLFNENAEQCGHHRITQYNDRQIPPTCQGCIRIVERLKRLWFETFPEIQQYLKWVGARDGIQNNRGILHAVASNYIRGGLGYSDMANTNFQHLAALGAKHALWKVQREAHYDRKSPLYRSKVLILLHDELFGETPEDRAHDAASRVSDLMVDAMHEFIPDVKIKAPPAIMRRWYKDAEPVFDANGRLIPWEPVDKTK
ncbi:MAG: hypothetical protein E6R03_17945 [Hyphomicrobiaceae bacterium]|nr:MAG: hypothetical protein E6R03_17945 [Hyphomicrobiaceae bacterium]